MSPVASILTAVCVLNNDLAALTFEYCTLPNAADVAFKEPCVIFN